MQNLQETVLYIQIFFFAHLGCYFFILLFPSLSLWLIKLAISSILNTADVNFIMPFLDIFQKNACEK